MRKRFGYLLMIVLIFFISGCSEKVDSQLSPELEVVEAKPDWIEKTIAEMNLRQKIAGLIIVGVEGTTVNTSISQMWAEYPFGGVIIYERNYVRDDWLKDFISELSLLSKPEYPLLVCIDEEGGVVSRLPGETFPAASELALASEEETYRVGQAMAEKLSSFGIYVNFAPVLDINIDPRNSIIGSRSFGSDPELVSAYGISLFKGMESGGIISAGKHYPGHGSTLADSHIELPVLEKNREELLSFELIPFIRAVEAGIPMIMTAHIVVSGIDEKPATMSKQMINILRTDLGFEGVIITDDLEMGALTEHYSWKEIIIEAFLAGADLLLIGHDYNLQTEAVHILEEAFKAGLISDERLNGSLRRVMEIQGNRLPIDLL
jgi:beta-N-acetylhexosaminidase